MYKPKILYLGNVLSGHGFTPTTIETLSKKLATSFEVVVASSHKNKVVRMLDMWLHIWRNRRSTDYVLIDTYSSSAFHFAWTSGALARALGLKYIAFLHGGSLPDRFVKSAKTSRKFLSGAKAVVSPSGYLQHAVKQSFKLEATVISNYLELELYPFLLRDNVKEVKLLWVRSFHESYNPTMAVQLVAWLQSKGVSVFLTMIGPAKDNSLTECKQLAAALGVEEAITFTGRLSKADWIELSAAHNLFINTTNADNTPVSVMEAMALGLPVVTTDVGGIPFLFEDGTEGIMTPMGDVEKMGEAIMMLRSHPKTTREISLAARKKAASWDWAVVEQQWIKLLTK